MITRDPHFVSSETPVSGELTPTFHSFRHKAYMWHTNIYIGKALIHIKLENNLKIKNKGYLNVLLEMRRSWKGKTTRQGDDGDRV